MLTQVIISGLITGSLYALVAMGLVMIYKATEVVNFAHGDLLMIGCYIGVLLYSYAHLPLALTLGLAIILAGVFGVLIERIVFRPLIKAPIFSAIIATLAVGAIFREVIQLAFGPTPRAFPFAFSIKPMPIELFKITPYGMAIVAIALAVMVLLFAFFRYTKFGKAMRAVSENQYASKLLGLNVELFFGLTWGIGALLAALAGLLLAPMIIITPFMGIIGIKAFVAAILGGFTSLPGAVVGGLALGVIENMAGAYISSAFKDIVTFLVLILVLIFRPTGIFQEYVHKRA